MSTSGPSGPLVCLLSAGYVETLQTTPKHPKPPQTTSKPSQNTFLTHRICFVIVSIIEEEIIKHFYYVDLPC